MKLRLTIAILICLLLVACDRVGSKAWCEKLEQKPTGDWTVDEVKDHTKYCVLGPVSYTHLTLPTNVSMCRSRWSPYH